MQVAALDHIVLTTRDLTACLAFYAGMLGMEHVERNGRHELRYGSGAGRAKINIHTRPAEFLPAAETPTPGSLDLCFAVADDIDELYASLRQADAPLVSEVVARTGARGPMRSVYLRDPDGNLVELASYA